MSTTFTPRDTQYRGVSRRLTPYTPHIWVLVHRNPVDKSASQTMVSQTVDCLGVFVYIEFREPPGDEMR